MQVDFRFSIGETVRIKANSMTGSVQGNYIGPGSEKKVDVQYADTTGNIHSGWFMESDLDPTG